MCGVYVQTIRGQEMSDADLSHLQLTERQALVLDRESVLDLVNAVRRYRQAAKTLLSSRYRDGECDAVALCNFDSTVREIEQEEYFP